MRDCTGSSGAGGSNRSGTSPQTISAKFYKVTRAGRTQLIIEEQNWERLASATMKALRAN